ncbi:hypothetical protein OC835_005527, partial [Tilletia horrida]
PIYILIMKTSTFSATSALVAAAILVASTTSAPVATHLAERQSAMGQDQPRCPSTGCAARGSGFNEAGRTPPIHERDTFAAAPGPGFNEAGRTPPLHERRSISDSALGADQPTCPPSGCAAHGRSISHQDEARAAVELARRSTLDQWLGDVVLDTRDVAQLTERQSGALAADQPTCPPSGCAAHGRSVSSQTTLIAERQSAMGQDQPRCPSTGCAAHGSGFNEAGRTPPLHERDTFAAAPGPGFNEAGRTPPLHERRSISDSALGADQPTCPPSGCAAHGRSVSPQVFRRSAEPIYLDGEYDALLRRALEELSQRSLEDPYARAQQSLHRLENTRRSEPSKSPPEQQQQQQELTLLVLTTSPAARADLSTATSAVNKSSSSTPGSAILAASITGPLPSPSSEQLSPATIAGLCKRCDQSRPYLFLGFRSIKL